MHVGDYTLEDTLTIPFTTRSFSTGIPTILVSGEVQIYEDDSVTQITAAETTTVSLDSVVGFNLVSIAATAANGFENGKSYTAILSAGTVGGVSVVGEVVGHFTIGRSAAAVDLANATDGLGAIKAETALIVADLPQRVTKNVALANFPIKMVDATDYATAETGLTVTATRSLDGAAFGACANAVSEVASGWYKINLDAADLNGDTVVLRFTATGAAPREVVLITQPT